MPKAPEASTKPQPFCTTAFVSIRHLLPLLLLTLSLTAHAQLTYTAKDGAITITGYSGDIGDLIIPGTIDGLPVRTIGDSAFAARGDLKSVILPNGVTSIENFAFFGCYKMPIMNTPDSVTSIGDYAFASCHALIYVFIPNGLSTIGNHAFSSCFGLTDVTIPDGVISIGDNAFYSCYGLTNVIMGSGLTSIGSSAFGYCEGLTSITIPNSVTNIPNRAFDTCVLLTNVTLGSSVTAIGDFAFSSCSSLTSVNLPNSVDRIGRNVFFNCYQMTNLTIGRGVTSVGDFAFSYSGLTSISVDEANPAFSSVGGILFNKDQTAIIQYPSWRIGASYTIPKNITSVGNRAFSGSLLTAIFVDEANPTLSSVEGVLFDKNQTTLIQYPNQRLGSSYTISSSVTRIGDSAFHLCSSLTNVFIPDRVTAIGDSAFSGCSHLTSLSIPNMLTNISDGAFSGCSDLTRVIIPNRVITIGNSSFSACSDLSSVTIPHGVISIGDGAFSGCSSLTSLTIPSSITNLGPDSFAFCPSLTGVYFAGNSPFPGQDSFLYSYLATVYYLPGTTGWGAFYAGRPTVLWNPTASTVNPTFGVKDGQFGFTITGSNDIQVVVEVCDNLSLPIWRPVSTNTLTSGSSPFTDPASTNQPSRIYRFRSP